MVSWWHLTTCWLQWLTGHQVMDSLLIVLVMVSTGAGHCPAPPSSTSTPSPPPSSPPPCSSSLLHYSQEDPELVEVVSRCHLLPPPPPSTPYTFSLGHPNLRGQVDQPVLVDLMYNMSTFPGVFVEAGAWDGEELSNSLLLEVERGWGGLLVEPNKEALHRLRGKGRKVWSTGTCLSPSTRPTMARLEDRGLLAGLGDQGEEVLCLPLYTLLLAMGNPTIHYLSLDIEGLEMEVVRTVPWDRVEVWVVSVETNHGSSMEEGREWRREELVEVMEGVGYRWAATAGIDDLFYRRDRLEVSEEVLTYIRQTRLPR